MHEPVPQSLRQQELVCLVERARQLPALPARVGRARAAPVERVAATRTVTPATAAALALFGLAFVVSIGFVVANGSLALTAAAPTSSPDGAVLGEVETAAPSPELDGRPDRRADADADAVAQPDPIAEPESERRVRPRRRRRARRPSRPQSRPRSRRPPASRC